MKTASIAMAIACSPLLIAADRDKPSAPIIIPLTGSGQATTSKLGNAYITRTGGQSFTTTQLGSSTVTRDSKDNSWTTTKLGNGFPYFRQ